MPRPNGPIPPEAPPALADFAQALRTLRENAGLTLKQLAVTASCSQAALSEAASGKRLPTWEVTKAYIQGCGANPARWREPWEYAKAAATVQSPAWRPDGGTPNGAPPDNRRVADPPVPGKPVLATSLVPPGAPDPVLITSREEFVRGLKALRRHKGEPSFMDMSQLAAMTGTEASPTALREACARTDRLPAQKTVDAFLAAFGITEDKHKKQKREWDNALKRARNVEARHKQSLRSRRSVLIRASIVVCVAGAVIGGYLLSQSPARATGTCAPGQLAVEGSTAFTPAASAESQAYQASCGGAHLTLVSEGSIDGLNSLLISGPQGAEYAIAMSDGPAPGDPAFAPLHGTPVTVVVFDIVVNTDLGIRNLTIRQLRDIYAGRDTNWKQVGGPDVPIRLVSRGAESGTRATFEKRVLGAPEPPVSSTDCVDKDRAPKAPVIRCEESSTPVLLARVASTPGAIGYAEAAAARQAPGVMPVTLDGREPAAPLGPGAGAYPFWTVEYLYTYGQPPYQAPASGFLRYMATPAAKDILSRQGLTSCYDSAQQLIAACQHLSFGAYGV